MEDLLKSREFLQQQIATTEAQLSQLNAALERTEQQIAAGRPTTATTTTNKPETVNKGEVPSEQNRRYPLEQDEYRRYGRQMIVDQIGLDGAFRPGTSG